MHLNSIELKENPTKGEVFSEIINLEAILNLPKGTEHFVSDLHGEFEAFHHILKNGSGNVKEKVRTVFHNELNAQEINDFCTLIYYPEKKMAYTTENLSTEAQMSWYMTQLQRLIKVVKFSASKYTRSKVRKSTAKDYQYILEELIYKSDEDEDKADYYHQILSKIISLGQAEVYIVQLSQLIQRLVVDHLHVVGDIYDRGPFPDKIMDTLMKQHSIDIQWGNHDMIWIGAMGGSGVCLANVIRICARYGNLGILEDTYNIDLSLLTELGEKHYSHNPVFIPKKNHYGNLSPYEIERTGRIHQAISIIQFKLEGQIIKRRPEFKLDHRLLLECIDYDEQTIALNNRKYPLTNTCFSTIHSQDPYVLTLEEKAVLQSLLDNFRKSERLKRHVDFMVEKGSMFLTYNGNLLYHGCIPLTENGDFVSMTLEDHDYAGKGLLKKYEAYVRMCYDQPFINDDYATDVVWYLWCGENSSLFGKQVMTTFERYFIADKETHIEIKNPYYKLRENYEVCCKILGEFGLSGEKGYIVNGHTPVKVKDGENPIKGDGKLIVIDGGFSRAYQRVTGIGGYTLLFNSYGLQLVAHQPFLTIEDAVIHNKDIVSIKRVINRTLSRIRMKDTDNGRVLLSQSNRLSHMAGKM